MIGDVLRKFHFVRDDDHRAVGRFQPLDDFEHLAREFRVERGGRFVKAENVGIEREGARDGDALLLTAGKFVGICVPLFGKPDAREQLLRLFLDARLLIIAHLREHGLLLRLNLRALFLRRGPPRRRKLPLPGAERLLCQKRLREGYVSENGVLRKQIELLKDKPEMQALFADLRVGITLFFRRVEQFFAAEIQLALVGHLQKIHAAQKRRFAAARRPDDGENLSPLQRERNALEHLVFAEFFAIIFQFEKCHRSHLEIVELLFRQPEQNGEDADEQQIKNSGVEHRINNVQF